MQEKIETLLQQLTIEEKISLLAGASMWYTEPVDRLGIPAIKVSDGPNGVRGGGAISGDVPSACFPVGIALGSTWNPELIERIGQALGEETKAKGAHVLLAPTVNIHRSPLNGRNFECYSEDPYLTARIAVAYIKGVQSQNVGATIKHYVCNDSEYERHNISSEVGERVLREIYLPPFYAAVKEAKVWAVMGAYNQINGTFACEHASLLNDILKKEWGFDGVVMSDWFGTRSTADSVNNGLDLEMPGPPLWRGEKLLKAFQNGEVEEAAIDDSVRRLLRIIIKSGQFDNPQDPPEQAIDKPEHRALIRQAAAEGIVLLKNDNAVLPLQRDTPTSLAIIGPNAKIARIMGGGSAHVNAHYAVTPFDGILKKTGDSVKIGFEQGCTNHKALPSLNTDWLTPRDGGDTQGLTLEYFNNFDLSGEPVWTTVASHTAQLWFGQFSPNVDPDVFSARFTGTLTMPETGTYRFSFTSEGMSRFYLNGKLLIDNWIEQARNTAASDSHNHEVEIDIVAGQPYELRIEYSKKTALMFPGFHLGCFLVFHDDPIERAVKLAAESDVALVFVGLNDEWESEGYDRPDMELVGDQVELLERVAAVNPKTVVVLNTGSPISMNWLDKVAAVLQAWYPGQECGNAIADVLFGDLNPSGKLSQTFPKRLEDNPAYVNYPGEFGKVQYGEGIFVGYRYYDKKCVTPLFPFGYGLSYTTFAYSNLRLDKTKINPDEVVQAFVDIQNTGTREGQEVVQLYIRDVTSSVIRPEKELKAFAKVALKPGETKTVTLTLTRESLAYYDESIGQWFAEAGEFEALVGSSSQDIRLTTSFTLNTSCRFGGRGEGTPRFGTHSTLRQLLRHEDSREILEKYLPSISKTGHQNMLMGFSLEQVAQLSPAVLTDDVMQAIASELAQL